MKRLALILGFAILLIGWTNKVGAAGTSLERDTLRSVTSIQLRISPIPQWAEANGTTRLELRRMIESTLAAEGIKLSDTADDRGGVLDLTVVGFDVRDPTIFFYLSRATFVQRVRLPDGTQTYAPTWQDDTFGATPNPTHSARSLISSVKGSLNNFISDYKIAKAVSHD